MKECKIDKKHVYQGLGFPVTIRDAPMVKIRGVWTLDINMNDLQQTVLSELAHSTSSLTGNQVRFIRSWLSLSYEKFAELFGVTHPAVVKWEKAKDEDAKISISTQREIRLHILDNILENDHDFRSAYRQVSSVEFGLVKAKSAKKSQNSLGLKSKKKNNVIPLVVEAPKLRRISH